ncbi:hypothetical protein PQX77_014795 [Marasmius sp. AFHP31]|nr:hypothetical protein PQX77_014795 [Marasmius sp. AFHP31]
MQPENSYRERTTRSKTAYSPYSLPQVFYASTEFRVEDGLKEIEETCLTKEQRGIDEFEDFEGVAKAGESDASSLEAVDADASVSSFECSVATSAAVDTPTLSFKGSAAVLTEEARAKFHKAKTGAGAVSSSRKRSAQTLVNDGPLRGPKLAKTTHHVIAL